MTLYILSFTGTFKYSLFVRWLMKNLFDFTGKVALITGGAGLLGPVFGRALADHGATVVLADVLKEKAQAEAEKIAAECAGRCIGVHLNLLEQSSVRDTVAQVIKIFGKIDILINSAQGVPPGEKETFEEYLPEHWDFSSDINLKGTFLCTQEAAKQMLKNPGDKNGMRGVIINLSSIYGTYAPDQRIYFDGMKKALSPSPAVYSATKGGIVALTKYLAAYYGAQGIRVNCISPGGVFTSQDPAFVQNYSRRVPLGRMANKEELAGIVVFLASGASSYVTGQNIFVDGGLSCW